MIIGRMDRRIVIEKPTTSRDDWNHPTVTWETLATVWATRRDLRSRERDETRQKTALTVTEWTIRHRGDITARHRIREQGGDRTWEIVGIEEIGREEGLRITAESRE